MWQVSNAYAPRIDGVYHGENKGIFVMARSDPHASKHSVSRALSRARVTPWPCSPKRRGFLLGDGDFFAHNLYGSPVPCTDFHYPPDLHGDQLSWSLVNVIFDYICTLEHTGQELQSKLRSGQFSGRTGSYPSRSWGILLITWPKPRQGSSAG